jgi:hypothetical protein
MTKIMPTDPSVGGTINTRIPLFNAWIMRDPDDAACV